MQIRLHKNATTTAAIRKLIQESDRVHPLVAGGYLTRDNNGLASQFSRCASS
jgi:hypothetical protein